MATLQKSFKYEADPSQSPFDELQVSFIYPIYQYSRNGDQNAETFRNTTADETAILTVDLKADSYSVPIKETAITSDKREYRYFLNYTKQNIRRDNVNLDGLSVDIDVKYAAKNNVPIGKQKLTALYFLTINSSVSPFFAMTQVNNTQTKVPIHIVLVNREMYEKIFLEFKNISYDKSPFTFYTLIQDLISVTNFDTVSSLKFDTALLQRLEISIRELKLEKVDKLVSLITDLYAQLFDFPLVVSEIKTLEISGTFEVKTQDSSTITKSDLQFYDLSVEYATNTNASGTQIMHMDWLENNEVIDDNTIGFSFTDTVKIIQNSIDGLISIKVKGFDGTLLWQKDFSPTDSALQDLSISVDLLKPNVLTSLKPADKTSVGKKLRGQLVGLSNKCPLSEVTVVIQAKRDNDKNWQTVGAATTDTSGNFSVPYPYGIFIEAQALVSLTPDIPAEIAIVSNANENQTISDSFLYLLVTDPICEDSHQADDDCDCHNPKKAPRLPDQEDLINSDQYSQDIGAGCVNLSTPNRTLREYNYQGIVRTSDPDVANYTLKKITPGFNPFLPDNVKINTKFELVGGASKIARSAVDLNNPIQWQDSPDSKDNLTFYQSVTVATGHILHYKSEFKADGYSLGNLLYSLPLAPGQKKQIVVMDSQHSLVATENQSVIQAENLAANLLNERDVVDQLGGSISEVMSGQSSASTGGISAGLGIGAAAGPIGGALGVAGGYASSKSSASQNSSRDTAQFFGEKLRQSIMQNADSYRQLNASVVTTVKEGQHYSATTEVVANHNHCHALTMMYFEVLRHYAIFQELVSVEECVFVPLLMTNFTTDNIFKWKDVLATRLLPLHSSTYLQPFGFLRMHRQHPLLKAFDANERIKTHYANIDFPRGRYCDESISSVSGSFSIRADVPRPKTKFDRILSLPIVRTTVTTRAGVDVAGTIRENLKSAAIAYVTGGLSLLFGGGPSVKYETESHDVLSRGQIFDLFMTLDENYESVPPAQCIRVHNFNPTMIFVNGSPKLIDFFAGMPDDKKLWDTYAAILGMPVLELLNKFSGNVISDWNTLFFNDIAPLILKELINEDHVAIKPFASMDFTSLNTYSKRQQRLNYNFQAKTSTKRAAISEIKFEYKFNASLTPDLVNTLEKNVTMIVESLRVNYATNHYNGRIFNGYVGNDLFDGITLLTPMNFDEKKNPRREDIFIVAKLVEHLNSNLEYYNKLLWHNLDIDRRFMLLDGFNIQIFNDFGLPDRSRSLASVVKNQLVTITGNSMVFPVAAGYKISQSYITAKNSDGEEIEVTLFDHYKPLTPIPPYRISVPSKGVFLEAIQGACDACEKIKENSAQDWTTFTADEPTSFATITPPTPTVTDWKSAFKDFATPMINIQNAPSLPEPGAGLAGLSELLGKSGIFKDITGLDANQQNAMKTYLSNQENAKAFAEMAKSMSLQGHNTSNSDKIMDVLKTAKDSGAINQEDYGKLVKEHIQKQIDGGESEKAALDKQKAAKPSLTDAAVKAVDQGKNVKAQKTDSEGNVESVDIEGSQPENILASVNGAVPKLKQENAMACWATAATMMVSWKKGSKLSVPQVLSIAGDSYLQKFNAKQGLQSSEKEDFIMALEMVSEPLQSIPLQVYISLLNTFGPLWITTDSSTSEGIFSPHARVLTKISGTGSADGFGTNFTFIDPATGMEVTESFTDFIEAFEQMVTDNPNALFLQIVHFIDEVSASGGEGSAVVDARKAINKFNPVASDTLVINMEEFTTGITDFKNYQGFKTDPAVRHNTKLQSTSLRDASKIKQIVIHETGSDSLTDQAFAGKYTAHLAVLKDNSVKQFNDLVEWESHATGFNKNSVGIEFSNLSWDPKAPASATNMNAKYTDDDKYLKVFWGVGYNIYKLPAIDQLEKLVDLVNYLVSYNNPPDDIKPTFDLNWHQLVSFDDVNSIWDLSSFVDPSSQSDEKRFFIMTKAHFYIKPSKFKDAGGIFCHANLVRDDDFITTEDHVDGSFESLYVWLRLIQHLDKDKAFENAKNLIANHHYKFMTIQPIERYKNNSKDTLKETAKRPVFVVDVNSSNLV